MIYELHVGAFTTAGTFTAAIERLDYLAELGVTAIELMPVAEFPGSRNWGYDGVLLFAPDASYGHPDDLKALVDAAHARGIMVLLDVVYNHFGPDGNYLAAYAPIFNDLHHTPWGAAVNYDAEGSETVREFVIQNAAFWIEQFHFDGLRLDAVHAIKDDSENHLLDRDPGAAARGRARPADSSHPGERGERSLAAVARRRTASRCNTPRSGTTTCITCCTPRPPARAPATTSNMPATPPSSAARWRKALRSRAT